MKNTVNQIFMKTIYLILLFISFSTLSFSQNFLKLEKKFLEKSQTIGLVGKDALNNYLFQNNSNSRFLTKNQLKKSNVDVNIIEQKLDSLLIVDFNAIVMGKNLYKYDSNGNCIEDIWYIYVEDRGLIKYRRYTSTYDEYGILLKNAHDGWDNSLNSWINRYSIEYDYSGNLLIKSVSEFWEDGKIDYKSKTEYSYNINQEVIERRHYRNKETNKNATVWEYLNVDSIHYNSQNQVIEIVVHVVNPIFKPVSRIVYKYDKKGDLTNWHAYYWNEDQNSWHNGGVREFNYDANRNLIQALIYFWDTEVEKLYGTAKYEFIYDENNNMVTCKEFDFNRDNEEWIQNNLFSHQYSDAGNLLDYKRYERDNNNGNFDLTENISYEYDETIPTEIIALPWNMNEPIIKIDNDVTYLSVSYGTIKCNQKLIKGVFRYPDNGTLVVVGELQLYYSSFITTGISDIKDLDFTVFPNPATESITFKWEKKTESMYLEIFNMKGQKVLNKTIFNNTPENINELNEGVYLYRLSDNGEKTFTGKLRVN